MAKTPLGNGRTIIRSCLLAAIAGLAVCGTAQSQRRITVPGNNQRVPYWKWQPAPPNMQLHLMAALSLHSTGEMEKLKAQLEQPGSPSYHKWLSSAEFDRRFGPSAAQMKRVTDWLTSHGFTIDSADLRMRQVRFSGSVAQAQRALGTAFVSSGSQYANLNDPRIPKSLAGSVQAFFGLNNLNSRTASVEIASEPEFRFPNSTASPHFSPQDFWTFYNESDPTKAGANGGTSAPDCIALLEYGTLPTVPTPAPTAAVPLGCGVTPAPTNTDTGVVNIFTNQFCLPPASITFIYTDPNNPNPAQPIDNEPNLDMDWAHAVAPNTPIKVYVATNSSSTTPTLDTLTAAVNDTNLCGAISSSIDDRGSSTSDQPCPSTEQITTYRMVEAQAVMQGQTLFHSSGDFGANYVCGQPASASGPTGIQPSIEESFASEDVTVVGGTEFDPFDADGNVSIVLGPGVEQVWQFATPVPTSSGSPIAIPTKGASGGGISVVVPTPSWQQGLVPYGMASPLPMRGVPDVSIAASGDNPGYFVATTKTLVSGCQNPPAPCFVGVGGTSASSPIWAAISRLVAQSLNNRFLGNINPYLYQLAANPNPMNPALVDVSVKGSNCTIDSRGVCRNPQFYPVGPSYDLGTGWGSPNIENLIAAFAEFSPGPTPAPTSAPTPGAQASSSPMNSSGAAGTTVNSGSVTITNASEAFESISSVTVSVSDPSLFSRMVLTGGGQTITVSSVASSTVFTFGPTPELLVPPGGAVTFNLSATLSDSTASLPAAYAGFSVRPRWLGLKTAPGAMPLCAGLVLVGLALAGASIPNRRRIALAALLAIGLSATIAGCGGSSSSLSSVASTQGVSAAAVSNAGGAVTVTGLPANLGTITET